MCIKDKYEKEPTRLSLYNFLLGAIVNIIITSLLYIIIRYYSQPHEEYNEPFDEIMYAVVVPMGFATTENLM